MRSSWYRVWDGQDVPARQGAEEPGAQEDRNGDPSPTYSCLCLYLSLGISVWSHACLFGTLSLSLSLSSSPSLSTEVSGAAASVQCRTMSVGVLVRESPQGGGSRSATHPAYKTVLGEGEEVKQSQPRLLLAERP